eukprot:493403_1
MASATAKLISPNRLTRSQKDRTPARSRQTKKEVATAATENEPAVTPRVTRSAKKRVEALELSVASSSVAVTPSHRKGDAEGVTPRLTRSAVRRMAKSRTPASELSPVPPPSSSSFAPADDER